MPTSNLHLRSTRRTPTDLVSTSEPSLVEQKACWRYADDGRVARAWPDPRRGKGVKPVKGLDEIVPTFRTFGARTALHRLAMRSPLHQR